MIDTHFSFDVIALVVLALSFVTCLDKKYDKIATIIVVFLLIVIVDISYNFSDGDGSPLTVVGYM